MLKRNEIEYLVSVWASEESPLPEIHLEASERNIDLDTVKSVMLDFLHKGEIGISKTSENGDIADLNPIECKHKINNLETQTSFLSYTAYLTEKGWNRYDTDTWGISVKRARQLLFSSESQSVVRV